MSTFADAYRAAAAAGADMRAVADAFETVRETFATTGHFLDACDALDDLVGAAWARPELDSTRTLRERLIADWVEREVDRLERLDGQTPDARWDEYVSSLARAVATWQLGVYERLREVEPADAPAGDEIEGLRTGSRMLVQERWAEAYPAFVYLAGAGSVSARDRARLNALCAAVQIFHLNEDGKAEEFLARAEELDRDEAAVHEVRSDYHLERDELQEAKRSADRALSLEAASSGAHCSMGDYEVKRGDLSAAESWYLEAIRRRPGGSSGYTRLCRLYGRPDFPESKVDQIPELVARAVSVDPLGAYNIYLEAGWAYREHGDIGSAREWFERAIDLHPRRPAAHAAMGHVRMQDDEPEPARAAFARAIEVAPKSFDGHWGMALLEEQSGAWADAEHRFRESMRLRPGWWHVLASRAAYAAWKQGRHEEALQELLDSLRSEPESTAIRTGVERIADETQSELGDLQGAIRIYDEIAGVLGSSYEERHDSRIRALYEAAALRQNSGGNELYSAGEFAAAIPLYERAIALDPRDAVYHSNLSSAWEMNGEVDAAERVARAAGALERAAELDPTDASYAERLARLRQLGELIPVFGDAALDRIPLVTPIALEVGRSLIPLVEGEGDGLSAAAQEEIDTVRARVLERFGVPLPGIRVRGNEDEASLPPGSFIVMIMEVPLFLGSVDEVVEEPGAEGWERAAVEHLFAQLETLLERHLPSFLGIQVLNAKLEAEAAELHGRISSRPGEMVKLAGVLRALLGEGVPVQPLGPLVERFERLRAEEASLQEIVEELRAMDELRVRLPGNQPGTTYYAVSDVFLDAFAGSIHADGSARSLAMEPETCQEVLAAVRDVVSGEAREALVVHRRALRPFVRRLLELEFPALAVLSSEELAATDAAAMAATVTMANEGTDLGAHGLGGVPEAV